MESRRVSLFGNQRPKRQLHYDQSRRSGTSQNGNRHFGRVITVNYNTELYPTSITQDWKDNNGQGSTVQHTWATFSYTNITVNTNFDSSLSVFGPPNGTSVKVLDKIIYPNGSSTQFEYNGYGQVWKVKNIAADSTSHILNYVSTNLQSPSSSQTDCPRFSETRSWVENFNNDQETVVTNTIQTGQNYNVGGISGTGTKIEVTMANHPHGAISKTFVGESGWMEGLPVATEDWANGTSGSERKRWTWTNWTQDDIQLDYILNPRVIESKVGDTTNIKRSTTTYRTLPNTTIAEYGLVSKVEVYDTDQSTIMKKVETDYNLDSAYISRRIIGLPSETRSYGLENSALDLASKTTYAYDEENFSQETNQNISNVIQHDNANYSANFIVGRGNLTSTTRHDVLGQSSAVTSKTRYDIAGSPVAKIDPLNRKVRIEYTDAFNDTTTPRNTFAYPTKIFDPAENFSEVKYRFDTGANVWAKSPNPNTNTPGKQSAREYDALGRLLKETLVNNGAYTRYEYPTNQIQSKVFTTIIDTNNNGADAADEVYSENWTDGAGRILRSRTEHPGSTGGWTGSLTEYDILGRTLRSTVPTEISVSGNTWTPAGDDNRGLDGNNNPLWLWTSQEYDWQSRVTREINTDGTDRLYNYEGCGCAGGQVTTIQSELVPRDDQPTINARRTQKVYQDILGRTYKTEILNWDGASVYTSTVQTFNRRDQIINTRQYAGTTTSSVYQNVTMTYDGHGRMKTRHYPIEDAATDTTWIYNADDSIQQVIDPRGVITNFTYNNPRGLLTNISYQIPSGSQIPATPAVGFQYDALGNRTQMSDGTGTTDYAYDELSRLESESKYFTDLPNAPVANNKYTISYIYDLSGNLKSITDPFAIAVDYTYDRVGRLKKVDGTALTNNPTGRYADNIQYRAFGMVKQIEYKKPNETSVIKMEYDNRLRVDHFEVTAANAPSGYRMKSDFTYFDDSRTASKDDLLDDRFDRTNKYDFAGRLAFNQFGMATNHQDEQVRLYEQNIQYDAFSMMTSRTGQHWGQTTGFTASYVNGRNQNLTGVTYDAAGNITNWETNSPQDYSYTHFDAAGRQIKQFKSSKGRVLTQMNMVRETQTEHLYDGAGRPVKESYGSRLYQLYSSPPPIQVTVRGYQVWSSVLGSALTSLEPDGTKRGTRVFAGGAEIGSHSTESASWMTADPVTGTIKGYSYFTRENYNAEREPLGQEVLQYDPTADDIGVPPANETINFWQDMQWQCEIGDAFYGGFWGMPFHCQMNVLQSFDVFLGDLLRREEKNPLRVITDSPMPKFDPPFNSPSDTILTYALKSTSKKDKKGKKKDNDDEWWCCDDDGNPYPVPTAYGGLDMTEIPGYQDVDKKGKVEFIKIPKDFKERVLERAGPETECGKKIIQLIDTLESNTGKDKFEQKKKDKKKNRSYIESLFNRVGKIGQNKSAPPFTADTGSRDFVVRGAKISMGLAQTDIIGKKGFEHIKSLDDVYDRYVSVFLHDLVHNASKNGRYTDQELLRAVIKVLKDDGKNAPEYTDNTRLASSRINDFFGEYCPLPKR